MPSVPSARSLRRVKSRAFAIEAALLRGAVGGLSAGRQDCRACHRTPLVGERVYLYEGRGGAVEVLCELCRAGGPGDPVASEVVRSRERSSVTPARPRE